MVSDNPDLGQADANVHQIVARLHGRDLWLTAMEMADLQAQLAQAQEQLAERERENETLRTAIVNHREYKWKDNGYRYDDWDSALYRAAGEHPFYWKYTVEKPSVADTEKGKP